MVIRFFNHAARWSDVIAFIFENETYDVPAVFQIWERRSYPRDRRSVERAHPDFVFTTYEEADFAIRRIGMRAGLVCDKAGATASSHYFIKGPVRAAMEMLDFSTVTENVAGPRSLSKSEIVALYRAWCDQINRHRSKVSGRYAWQRRGRFRSFQRAVSMR